VRILGLDTATWKASVGLRIDGQCVSERSRIADGSHAVSLLSLIEEVLRDGGCAVPDLDAVAVSGGPGSFTGLRIGLSIAKGLAYATGACLIAVPTLEALARTWTKRFAPSLTRGKVSCTPPAFKRRAGASGASLTTSC
jgi:tRNA threonylcarbamoyladenosine biosynthesis protein TsaB